MGEEGQRDLDALLRVYSCCNLCLVVAVDMNGCAILLPEEDEVLETKQKTEMNAEKTSWTPRLQYFAR